jgi:hypothetical protein
MEKTLPLPLSHVCLDKRIRPALFAITLVATAFAGNSIPEHRVTRFQSRDLAFVENGCTDTYNDGCFQVSAGNGTLRLRDSSAAVDLAPESLFAKAALRLQLADARSGVIASGEGELPGKANYLLTGDPKTWRTNLRMFRAVRYRSVYPGIDLVYYGSQGRLEYDFVVAPGGDPSRISIDVRGAPGLSISAEGDLLLDTGRGSFRFSRPTVYQQDSKGNRKLVAGAYVLEGSHRIRFHLAPWDPSRQLVIDPVLAWSTFAGASTAEQYSAMTADGSGNVYVAGRSAGALTVEKLNPTGNAVVYHTVFGAGYSSSVQDIAVDSAGKVYVVGGSGVGFPTTATAAQKTIVSGSHTYMAVLASTGASLAYATYIAGTNGSDQANGVAVDGTGKVYVTGTTSSTTLPVTPGVIQATLTSGQGGFVAKIDPGLSGSASLVYLTYLSGPSIGSTPQAVAVDTSGNAYVAGNCGGDFPATPGAFFYDGVNLGQGGVFVTKLNPTATALAYSALLGSGTGNGIAVDGSGNAYVTGTTSIYDFPTTAGAFQTNFPGAFASELNAAGSALVFSTFLGGSSGVQVTPTDIAIPAGCASACSATVAGFTAATDYPVVNPIQSANFSASVGGNDFFVTQLNGTGTAAVYSTYLGGTSDESNSGFSHSPSVAAVGADVVVSGITQSSDFPVTLTSVPQRSFVVVRISAAAGALAVSVPASLSFTTQQAVHAPSPPAPIILRNMGSTAMSITGITGSGDFAKTDNCGVSLAAGASCTISVTFTPSIAGARTATVTVTHSGTNSPFVINVSGTGVNAPFLSLSTNVITFPQQAVGTASPAQAVTLTNTGNQALTLTLPPSINGDFGQTNNCPASVAANASCTIKISFLPTQSGPRSGSLFISSNTNGQANASIALNGTGAEGVEALTVTNKGIVFAPQVVGTTSFAQNVAILNSGSAPVTIFGVSSTLPDYILSGCALTLNPGASCNVRVSFAPTVAGARNGTVTLVDSSSVGTHTFTVAGTGVNPTSTLSFSSPSIVFPDQAVGGTTGNLAVIVTNTGNNSVSISRVFDNSGDFRIVSTSCANPNFRPGFTCTININFSPTAAGLRTGTITLVSTATGSPQTISLSGTGLVAVNTAVVSPPNLTFGTQAVGSTSGSQSVILYNTGNIAIAVSVPATAGDFQTSTICGATLLVGRNCSTAVTFTPTAAGARTATLTLTTDAGPKTISLSGTGVASSLTLGFAPTTMAFPAQNTTTTSATRNLIIRNTGSAPVNITNIAGTSAEFLVSPGGCINTLQPGTNCAIQVSFAPTVAGARSGNVTITSNATGSPQTVALTGTGSATLPTTSLNPSGLAFSQVVGTTSQSQSVNLVNNTATSITGITFAHTGDFATPTTCAATLAAGAACFFSVTFTPTAAGLRTGTVAITDSLGTQTVSLAGFGVAPSTSALLRETALTFPDEAVGISSPVQNIVLTNTGTNPLTVSSAVPGGTNPGDFSISNGCSTLNPGQSCNVSVTFTPTATGARAATVIITDNSAGSPRSVTLSGKGVASALKLEADRTTLAFPPTPVGIASNSLAVNLTNVGDAPITVSTVTPGGTDPADYSVSNSCSSVPPPPTGNSCSITVTFTPKAAGARPATLTIAHSAGASVVVNLSGTGVADGKSLVISPNGLMFGPQVVGTTSAPQTINVTNSGNFVVTFTNVTVNGNYSLTNGCTGQLQPASSCTINVSFTPSSAGAKAGTLTIADDATGSPQSVTLTGVGIAASNGVSLSETLMVFPPEQVNVASPPQDLYYVNQSAVPITISSVVISTADFTQNHVCDAAVVSPGSFCKITVTFKPGAIGAKTATLTVSDNAPGSPRVVNLTGLGSAVAVPYVTLVPTTLTFNSQSLGTSSGPQTVTLTNLGSATLTVSNIQITGTNPGDFTQTSACPTVAPGFSCAIAVTFSPIAVGARTATLTITDNATGSPHSVTLNGTATAGALPAVTLTPTSLAFPNVPLNTAATPKTVTVKNTGSATLNVTNVSITGTVPGNWGQTNNCTSVAVNATCTITVTFTPTSLAAQTGTVTITDNAPNTPQTVSLTGNGTGAAVQLQPSSLSFGARTVGATSAPLTVMVQNIGTAPLTFTSVVTSPSTEFLLQSNTCTGSVGVGLTCTIGVAFKPAAAGTRTGFVTITDNAGGSPQYVFLTGSGT